MIRSSEIDQLNRARFDVTHYWPLYGNVVGPLVNAVKASSLDQPAVAAIIGEAIDLESQLADRGVLPPTTQCT